MKRGGGGRRREEEEEGGGGRRRDREGVIKKWKGRHGKKRKKGQRKRIRTVTFNDSLRT